MSFGHVPMSDEDYYREFKREPEAIFSMAIAEIMWLRDCLEKAHEDLDAYKAENRELKGKKK